ncbi:MAG: hypothetical protein PHY18_03110 [Dehalococcoidales bacterium]|nr:hypothetical protein [Dehalococcoidales bacterium]
MRSRAGLKLMAIFLIPSISILLTGCFTTGVPATNTTEPDETALTTEQALPVIHQFSASPDNISPGEISKLSWSVSNATIINIDNGIGNVALSGERNVTPSETTIYTLTATGPGGSNTATVQVMVTPLEPPVINSFTATPDEITAGGSTTLYWNVSNASSVTISPDIGDVANEGSREVSPSETTSYSITATNGDLIETETLIVEVSGVSGVAHVEWLDEQVAYDFVERAPSATWAAGLMTGMFEIHSLSFPGTTSDNQGYACYQLDTKLNDGITYDKLLETHPRWIDNGFISGRYSDVNVPPGATLKLKAGIINGYTSGSVRFNVRMIRGSVYVLWTQIVDYGDGTQTVEIDLSDFADQNVDFELLVEANGVSTQDWAAWAEAKIVH